MDAPVGRWTFLGLVALGITLTVVVHLARLPTGARGYYNRGVEDNRQGRYESAVANFDRALEIEPARVDAYVARGMTWVHLDRPFRALEDADAALRVSPESSRAYFVRGRAQEAIGREEAALRDFERAAALDPRFARAELARASVLLDQGRHEAALAAARQAWSRRLDDPPAYHAPMIAWAARALGGDGAGADEELASAIRGAGLDRDRLEARPAEIRSWMDAVRRWGARDAPGALDGFRRCLAEAPPGAWSRDRARAAAESLVLGFRVERINREISESLSFGPGLPIRALRAGGPAERAGLALGDRIVRIGGEEVSEEALARIVRTAAWGDAIRWEGERRGEAISGELRPASSAPTR